MSQPWQLALQRDALRHLLALRGRERERLLDALDRLAAEPYAPHDFSFRSAVAKREYHVKLVTGFTITYWLDHFANEVRVMQIARIGRG